MSLSVKGTLTRKLEIESGTSKAGNEWKKQSFILDTGSQYNPEIKQGVIPPLKKDKTYSFRLPKTASPKFDSLFALVQEEKIDEIVFKTHKVKYGENLSLIAKKYNVPIKDIVSLNKIKNPNRIKPKTILQIPVRGYQE